MTGSRKLGELALDFRIALRGVRRVAWWAAAAAVVVWLLSGFSSIDADSVGFVRRFGHVVRKDIEPGLTFLLPWPIDQLDTVPKKDIRRTESGFSVKTVRNHVKISETNVQEIPYCLTGDQNIVHISMVAQYRIKDPYRYLYSVVSPDAILTNVLNDAVLTCTASMTIDGVLTTEKEVLRSETRQLAQTLLDDIKAGLFIEDLQLKTPPSVPEETEAAFQSVVDAKVGMQTAKYQAEDYTKRVQADADGYAAKALGGAHAAKLAREEQAQSDAQRFLGVVQEYQKNKEITRQRMYLEAMDEIMTKVRKYVLPAGGATAAPQGSLLWGVPTPND